MVVLVMIAVVILILWLIAAYLIIRLARQPVPSERVMKNLIVLFNFTRRPGEFRAIDEKDLKDIDEIDKIKNNARNRAYSFGFLMIALVTLGLIGLTTGDVVSFILLAAISAPIMSLCGMFLWLFMKLVDRQSKLLH
jgi:hypothetical protein